MTAPVIAIYGPEGAGKSTTVAALQHYLQNKMYKTKIVFLGRGKNNIIPINKLGKGYKEKEAQLQSSKSQSRSSKKILYTLIAGAFTIDLLLRYAIHVLPSRLQSTIVICDRYSSDLFLMDKVPLAIRKMLLWPFPKPTMTFYLYNTVEKLHERKGRSLENLRWQMEQFNFLNQKYTAITIKTDNTEETLQKIVENVMLIEIKKKIQTS